MNRSPEKRASRPSEAELETALRAADAPPKDRELAADWSLRRELAALGPDDALPTDLRRAVLHHATNHSRPGPRHWRGLPAALAAGLAGVLVLVAVLQPGERQPSPPIASTADVEDLQLALATLDRTSRRAMDMAGREVREHLEYPEDFPRIELERLPYGRLLASFRRAPPHSPKEN